MNIELSVSEFDLLIYAIGLATGWASKEGIPDLRDKLINLANAVNRNNPNWIPYEVKEVKS